MQGQIEACLKDEDFLGALPYKEEKTHLLSRIASSCCCLKCGIACPSKYAHPHLSETWYQSQCGHCHTGAGVHGSAWMPSRGDALNSLRSRALAELQQASHVLDCSVRSQKVLSKSIHNLETMWQDVPRRHLKRKKPTVPVCLAGQLVRTRSILCQYGSHDECLADIDACLRLLGYGSQPDVICTNCGIEQPCRTTLLNIPETWYQDVCGYCHKGAGLGSGQTHEATRSVSNRALRELEEASSDLKDYTKFKRKQISRAINELKKLLPKSERKILKQGGTATSRVCLAGQLARTRALLVRRGMQEIHIEAIDAALMLMGFK